MEAQISCQTHLVSVGTEAEVLHGLTGVLGSTEEEGVGTGGSAESKLVQGQSLTTSLLNASASGGGEAESSDRELGNVQEAVVIGNGADDDDGLALLGLADVRDGTRERNRGAVNSRHKETTENSLVEVGLGTAYHSSQISLLDPPKSAPYANENRERGRESIRARKR
jgi:hypothetical protein